MDLNLGQWNDRILRGCLFGFLSFILVILYGPDGFLYGQSATQEKQSRIQSGRQTALSTAISRVSPAVVGVNVTQTRVVNPFNDPFFEYFFGERYRQRVQSLGSGFLVSPDGYILTNAHVVTANPVEIVITTPGGEEYQAELIGIDNISDLALVKIDGNDHPYAELGNSGEVVVGEWVVALGNPFGLFDVSYQPSATVGIISGLHLDFGEQSNNRRYTDMIQTDAAINTGNSGGPLVNADGEVIGINTFIFTSGRYDRGSVGIGFAIPINRAKRIMEELKEEGKVDWSFNTGLTIHGIDRNIASAMDLPVDYGIIVTGVKPGSPADKAGLKVQDVITEAEGEPIRNQQDIFNAIQDNFLRAGDTLHVKVWRDGKSEVYEIKLESSN